MIRKNWKISYQPGVTNVRFAKASNNRRSFKTTETFDKNIKMYDDIWNLQIYKRNLEINIRTHAAHRG